MYKLLADAKKYGLDVMFRYFADSIELDILNKDSGTIRMSFNNLDKLKIMSLELHNIYLTKLDNMVIFNTEYMNCDFLANHGFSCIPCDGCIPDVERDYRPFDLNAGFEFELSWFAEFIELSNKLSVKNAMTARQAEKIRKMNELTNEAADEFI